MKVLTVLFVASGLAFAQQDAARQREPDFYHLEQAELQRRADILRQAQVQQLEAANAQLNNLRTQYTEAYPAVRAAEARIRELEAALRPKDNPPELWWKDERYRVLLGVSPDQQTKIDDVFQQYRLKLIDLNATLQKEEITLEPLIAANPPNEAKATTQIDRVAQARAELEKARGRMLLAMRKLLTVDQWKKLSDFSK